MFKRKTKWEKKWADSLDLYSAAFSAAAEGWGQATAQIKALEMENKALKEELAREREKHSSDVQLLTAACEGSTAKRQELLECVKALKAENVKLESENKRVNTTLDIISAYKNGEVIDACFEEMEGAG